MFKTGDIVSWAEDPEFWIIIEQDLPNGSDSNAYLWRMRTKNDQGWPPKLMRASSKQINLVCRPYFFANQELIFRQYIVSVIKDAGARVHCEIISTSECRPSRLTESTPIVHQKMEILKSALVESNISIFIR